MKNQMARGISYSKKNRDKWGEHPEVAYVNDKAIPADDLGCCGVWATAQALWTRRGKDCISFNSWFDKARITLGMSKTWKGGLRHSQMEKLLQSVCWYERCNFESSTSLRTWYEGLEGEAAQADYICWTANHYVYVIGGIGYDQAGEFVVSDMRRKKRIKAYWKLGNSANTDIPEQQ